MPLGFHEVIVVRGGVSGLNFADGSPIARAALFFLSAQHQHSGLPESLGCKNGTCEATNIPGWYVTGNVSACGGTRLAIVAAGQGGGSRAHDPLQPRGRGL